MVLSAVKNMKQDDVIGITMNLYLMCWKPPLTLSYMSSSEAISKLDVNHLRRTMKNEIYEKEICVSLPCCSCLLIFIYWLVLLNYLLNKLG